MGQQMRTHITGMYRSLIERTKARFNLFQASSAPLSLSENSHQLSLFSQPLAKTREDDELIGLWRNIRHQYFPDQPEIDSYRVVWSPRRHTRTLASCSVRKKRIIVALAMSLPEANPHLEALLYHEMCHAALGEPQVNNRRRVIHGREFKQLERLHPGVRALDRWIKSGGWRDASKRMNRIRGAAKRSNTLLMKKAALTKTEKTKTTQTKAASRAKQQAR